MRARRKGARMLAAAVNWKSPLWRNVVRERRL
jgi:hypothetical protein